MLLRFNHDYNKTPKGSRQTILSPKDVTASMGSSGGGSGVLQWMWLNAKEGQASAVEAGQGGLFLGQTHQLFSDGFDEGG